MLAEFAEYLVWWQIPILLLFVAVSVFGGGALLWVGGKYIAQAPRATYWRSVATNLLAGLVTSFCSLLALPLAWLIIKGMFRTTYGKAILAWLPTIPTSLFAVGLWAAILVPALQQANELTNRTVCMSNLSSIGKGLTIYKGMHDNRFPPSLDALIAEGQPRKHFVCPSVEPDRRPAGQKFDYFYLPPESEGDMSGILICDFRANHRGKQRNVLSVGMAVRRLTEPQFQAELARPINARFAEALRKVEGP